MEYIIDVIVLLVGTLEFLLDSIDLLEGAISYRDTYVWGLVIVTFGGWISYVWGLVNLTLEG